MDTLALASAWLAASLIVIAALVPLGVRALQGRRAVLGSRPIATHVVLGFSATATAVAHTFSIVPALGSPAAIRGGMTALAPATLAFFLLFAHVGVGLRLRNPKLRERPKVRRLHVVLASTIVAAVAAHVTAVILAS